MAPDPRQLDLIPHEYQGEVIRQRAGDGYINATAMTKAAGKKFNDYSRNEATKAFLQELSSETGIPATGLVQTFTGGTPHLQGTWVHPHVAINLAQWCSAKFAVRVSTWVYEWMTGAGSPVATKRPTPIFVQRFNENWDRVERCYFSIINELFIRVYGRLEQAGYVLKDKSPDGKELRPDVSVGLLFPKWLESYYPDMAAKWKPYRHTLVPQKKDVEARQYHNSVLPAFIEYVETDWLPNCAAYYFKKRDPGALQYLPKLLPAPKKAA